jgi:outer membrane protein, heavy metal efflux system
VKYDRRRWDSSGAMILMFILSVAPAALAQSVDVPRRLTLSEARDLLLAHNPALLRDEQDAAIARANVGQARLRLNPELEIDSESYPIFEPRPGSFWNNQELTLRASQTLETAGKRRNRIRVAQNDLSATGSDVQNTIRQLTLELKRRYYAVTLAQTQLQLAQDLLKGFDELIRLNEARYQQGDISGLELARVRAERLRFFNDVLESRLSLSKSRVALLELLGATDLSAPVDTADSLEVTATVPSADELQRLALQHRPDLVAEQQRLTRNRSQLDLEKSLAVPNVSPTFGYKRDFGLNTVVAGISIPLPFFNRNQPGITRATAGIERQNFELQRVRLSVMREVLEAQQAFATQSERVAAIARDYLPNVQRARDSAQESYRLGELDLIGLLDSERVYRETSRTFSQSLYDRRIALALVEAAVGKEF